MPTDTDSPQPETIAALRRIEHAIASLRDDLRGLGRSPEPALASKLQAANFLGLGVRSVEDKLYRGELPSRKVGRRRLIPWAALREYARADHPIQACAADPPDAAEPGVAE